MLVNNRPLTFKRYASIFLKQGFKMKDIELIVPCASFRDLEKILTLPVSAIYVGIAGWSRANRGNEFSLYELKDAVAKAHALGKRVYLSFNLMPSPHETRMAFSTLRRALDYGVDAVIASEPSIIATLAQEGHEVHASLGTASINKHDVAFYADLGAKRVVLSPNLSIEEIDQINGETKILGVELEVMVYGIKCIATYLGICRLSSFFDMFISNCGVRCLIWEGSAKRSGICFRPCAQEWFTKRESFLPLAPLTNFELYSVRDILTLGVKNIKIGGRGMPFCLLKGIISKIISSLETAHEKV